ncbi:MAG: hypothetical protein AAGA28_12750 [Pseudomonadota bacterium]
MNIDLLHTFLTAAIIFGVVYGVEHSGLLEGQHKTRRALITAAILVVFIGTLNVLWPYAAP